MPSDACLRSGSAYFPIDSRCVGHLWWHVRCWQLLASRCFTLRAPRNFQVLATLVPSWRHVVFSPPFLYCLLGDLVTLGVRSRRQLSLDCWVESETSEGKNSSVDQPCLPHTTQQNMLVIHLSHSRHTSLSFGTWHSHWFPMCCIHRICLCHLLLQ